jgi:hypothetical protein
MVLIDGFHVDGDGFSVPDDHFIVLFDLVKSLRAFIHLQGAEQPQDFARLPVRRVP